MSGTLPRVLLVEDEADLAASVAENLEAEGHEVKVAGDGEAGLEAAEQEEFDLVLLDVMLPGIDGFEVCRRLRASGCQVPVLFLTARSDPEDRIRGLEEGGDDYLTKPFHLKELLLRVSAILRRSAWYETGRPEETLLQLGAHEIDLRSYTVRGPDGNQETLSHKEAMILKLFVESQGGVVSREEILATVWGTGAFPTTRTIDNFIVRLRRRFEPDPHSPRHFHTVHGVGYRFTPSPE